MSISLPILQWISWKELLASIEQMGWHIELHCEPDALAEILPTLALNHSNNDGLYTDSKVVANNRNGL